MQFIKIPNRIFEIGLSPAELLVFAALRALDRNSDNYVITRGTDIAALCGLHRNSVSKAIAGLQEHKLIRKVQRYSNNGYRTANSYYIASVSRKYFLLPINIFSYGLSPSAFCVYCYLASCQNHSGRAFPSLRKISANTALCIDTVISSVEKLSSLQLLSKSRYVTSKHDYGCNNYCMASKIIKKVKGYIKKIARAAANSRTIAKDIKKLIFYILLLKLHFVKHFLFFSKSRERRLLFFRLGVLEKLCNLY